MRGLYTDDLQMVNCEVIDTAAPADGEFKGRMVEAAGVVKSLTLPTAATELPVVVLEGPTNARVAVEWVFKYSDAEALRAALKPGKPATLRGRCGGRSFQTVRIDDFAVVEGGDADAARVPLFKLYRAFEADLVTEAPADLGRPASTVTAAQLAEDFQADPSAAREQYCRGPLEVAGTMISRDSGTHTAVLETATGCRYRVVAMFAPSRFREVADHKRVVLRCVCSGLENGQSVLLDDAAFQDPDGPEVPRVTADFLPLYVGRELVYYRTEPAKKRGSEVPITRVVMQVWDEGEIRGAVTRAGWLTGPTLHQKPLPRIRWTIRAERTPLEAFALKYRVGDAFVEIARIDGPPPGPPAPPAAARVPSPPPPPAWEPVLKLGAKAGESWAYAAPDGRKVTYTVTGFRQDATGRPLVGILKVAVNPVDKSREEWAVVYAKKVGEVERLDVEHSVAGSRVLREMKLMDGIERSDGGR